MQIRSLPLLAICLSGALAATTPAAGQAVDPSQDLAALQALAPRMAGSAAETEAMRYVETRLRALAVPYTVHPSTASQSGVPGPGAIIASVRGRSDRTLTLIAPLDHAPEALSGHEGSTAIVTALHMLKRASRTPLPCTLQVVFVAAEHAAPGGSEVVSAVLADGTAQEPTAVVYLNLDTIPGLIVLRTDGMAAQTPLWLVDAAANAFDHTGLLFTARSTANQLARIGLPRDRSMADPYLAAGLPAIELAGGSSGVPTATLDAWIDDFGSFIKSLGHRVAARTGRGWERHYVFVQSGRVRSGRVRLAVGELGVVASIGAALSLALALAFLMPRRLRRYRRLLLRCAWMPPLAALGIHAALSAATALLSSLLVVRDLPELWQRIPALALAFKGSTALLLILVTAKLLAVGLAAWRTRRGIGPVADPERGPPLEAAALSAWAVALLAAAIAAVTAIDPAASLPFICSYAAALLFCLARLRGIKTLWLAASIAAPAGVAADLIGAGADGLLATLLVSPRIGNAVLTLALLPFVLMALRLTLRCSEPLAAWGARRRLSPLILVVALISAATGVTLFSYPIS